MLPIAQLNLLPLAQLILLKQAVDAASEQWEREQTELKKGAEKTTESYDEETLTDGSPRFAYAYDARNRMATETKLDGSVTSFEYDAENNPALRSMPGGIKHHQAFDAANRITGEYLEGSDASTSRDIDYNYFTSTEDIGLLQSRVENTGTSDQITHSYQYDDLLRLERYTCDGANYTGFTHLYEYDLRSLLTGITRAPNGVAGDQLSTQVEHELDGYGQLLEERIYTGTGTVDSFTASELHSHIRQSWDGLGRRNRFGLGSDATPMGSTAPTFDYGFYASNRITTIAPNAFSDPWEVQYDYEDNLLLSERRFRVDDSYNARRTQTLNRRLDDTTPYRDIRGRLLRNVQTANGTAVLNETLAWSDDSKLGAYTLARGAGTGTAWDDFTDSRSHTYDPDNRRLDTESFLPDPSGSTRTFNYDFDSDDLGVRVKAALDNPASDAWEVNDADTTGLDAFMRVVDETSRSEKRSFTVSGSSTGPGVFELYLGEGASPSTFDFLQSIAPDVDYGDGIWSIPLSLDAGQYTLEARATHLHPDSNHQVTDSSTFTVAAPDPANITTTYDSHGRVETRSWASGDVVQTFSWDAKGNLLEIEQVDSGTSETVGSYVWTAQYDGLGRRIITDYAPAGASAIAIAQNRIKTWYDPQVEFMVAAVEHHGKREWLVHGPDLDTGYGAFQGLGGLEAIVDEATGETTPIVDTVHGHVVATISLGDIANAADDTVTFKEQQFGGYGPLPGSQQKPLETTESLSESLGWQTRCVDPTSFFAMGARHYDPLSGRFLSADPLGHGATPDLYSYAGGDPVNFVDPTGRNADEILDAIVYGVENNLVQAGLAGTLNFADDASRYVGLGGINPDNPLYLAAEGAGEGFKGNIIDAAGTTAGFASHGNVGGEIGVHLTLAAGAEFKYGRNDHGTYWEAGPAYGFSGGFEYTAVPESYNFEQPAFLATSTFDASVGPLTLSGNGHATWEVNEYSDRPYSGFMEEKVWVEAGNKGPVSFGGTVGGVGHNADNGLFVVYPSIVPEKVGFGAGTRLSGTIGMFTPNGNPENRPTENKVMPIGVNTP